MTTIETMRKKLRDHFNVLVMDDDRVMDTYRTIFFDELDLEDLTVMAKENIDDLVFRLSMGATVPEEFDLYNAEGFMCDRIRTFNCTTRLRGGTARLFYTLVVDSVTYPETVYHERIRVDMKGQSIEIPWDYLCYNAKLTLRQKALEIMDGLE